jgi:hypothetical protein
MEFNGRIGKVFIATAAVAGKSGNLPASFDQTLT